MNRLWPREAEVDARCVPVGEAALAHILASGLGILVRTGLVLQSVELNKEA